MLYPSSNMEPFKAPDLLREYQEPATLPALPSKEPAAEPKGLIDPAVVAKFKATGPGWQARMNDVLAAAKV